MKKTTAELVAEKPSPEAFATLPKFPVTVVVDNVRSLDNVGLLFRLSDAFRIEKLILCGITGYPEGVSPDTRPVHIRERHHRRIQKTAIYTIPFVPWEYREHVDVVLEEQKKRGSSIVLVEQTAESVPYEEAAYTFPLTLVVGHERQGVSDEAFALTDLVVEIPMNGMGNSHNVAVATALVLGHLRSVFR